MNAGGTPRRFSFGESNAKPFQAVGSTIARSYTRTLPRRMFLVDANGKILVDSRLPRKTCPWPVNEDATVIPPASVAVALCTKSQHPSFAGANQWK